MAHQSLSSLRFTSVRLCHDLSPQQWQGRPASKRPGSCGRNRLTRCGRGGRREETTEEEGDKVGRRRGNKKRANWALLGWPGWFHQLHSDIFYVCERSCIMQLDRISCSNVESDQTLRGWELISPLRQGHPDILDGERSSENFTPWFSPNIWTNLPWTHISDFFNKMIDGNFQVI